MAKTARKPAKVMGEAWFMGDDRAMFDYLGTTPVDALSDQQLDNVLSEIAGGTRSFGHMDEWDDWLAYLLPQLILVKQAPAHRRIIELAATAFFSLHPQREDHTDYNDALQTLGQVIMGPSRWHDGRLILEHVLNGTPAGSSDSWGWWNVGGDLSVSLFFCLKYLHPKHIKEWVESIFAIGDQHWRAQILVWLSATRELWDAGSVFPSGLKNRSPDVGWPESYLINDKLAATFISEENRSAFKDALWPVLALHLHSWRESIAQIDYLELEALPFIVDPDTP
ncbi:hypothetical protein F2P45_03045 [Massilia sp. CCM 8733]|uniref:Uncharacterized protein n=1 Tax=Massilia mucilaginosa TaxID=2609282 RepID=A0ABX0NMK0_9BURK|nr:hypothetical protein [Massilia mucilaginosa]NHZ88013.1 hypothetical protein [Massilia mucilaginosa]